MVDAIQARSSIPLPTAQTERAARDPLPLNSRGDIARADAAASEAKGDTGRDRFEDYLNESSVTTLEKREAGRRFDPVSEILAGSVYAPPGNKTPL